MNKKRECATDSLATALLPYGFTLNTEVQHMVDQGGIYKTTKKRVFLQGHKEDMTNDQI